MSSSKTTPKLYTSDLNVRLPVLTYSGAECPYVPTTLEGAELALSLPASLASPKSESLGLKSSSSKMFEDFRSLNMTGGLALSCKYSSPFAVYHAIFTLVNQSNGRLFDPFSAPKKKKPHKLNAYFIQTLIDNLLYLL